MSPHSSITRREFVETGAGFVLAFYLPARGGGSVPAVPTTDFAPNAWVRIGCDGLVTLTLDKSEMGQGSQTGLAMVLADELEADWATVRLGPIPENPAGWSRTMRTGGSNAIRSSWEPQRKAGAAAREMLVTAAARTWKADRAACRAERGAVVHVPSGRRLSYGMLAARAATLPVPADAPLKAPKDFRLIGTRVPRLDTPGKVDGTAVFGIDVKVPAMLVASIERSPVLGGKVKRFNADRARAMPGVRDVVELAPSSWMGTNGAWAAGCAAGVAVVAETYWQAVEGRRALEIEWDERDSGALDSASIRAQLVALADRPGIVAQTVGDVTAALAGAAKRIEAVYDVPFVHHATMEPMNCTAHVRAGECDVWAPTQNQGDAQRVAAEVTGLPKEKVRIHTTPSGGGFGRRLEPDFVSEAVRVSKAVGAPVKVIWTREDDMRNGFYRPTSYNRFSAGLDASGRLVAWTHRIAGRPLRLKFGPLEKGIDDSLVDGAIDLPYAIPNLLVDQATLELAAVPRGPWRSVGVSHNGFVTECFLDEIAAAGGRDPFDLRRELLRDIPRHRRTLARGCVVQGNFDTYPVVRMPDAPAVEVYIVPSSDPQGGAGEPGVPTIAPAVCNAIFAATGKRIRKLPIGKIVAT